MLSRLSEWEEPDSWGALDAFVVIIRVLVCLKSQRRVAGLPWLGRGIAAVLLFAQTLDVWGAWELVHVINLSWRKGSYDVGCLMTSTFKGLKWFSFYCLNGHISCSGSPEVSQVALKEMLLHQLISSNRTRSKGHSGSSLFPLPEDIPYAPGGQTQPLLLQSSTLCVNLCHSCHSISRAHKYFLNMESQKRGIWSWLL